MTKNFSSPTLDYHNLLVDLKLNGHTEYNERTGKRCTFLLNKTLTYDRLPYVATKKVAIRSAVAEMLGYLKGCTSAAEFRALGTKTWDANANENKDWIENPARRGTDDMGRVYGAQGRDWVSPAHRFDRSRTTTFYGNLRSTDQLAKVLDHLLKRIDDRGEIITFWNPGEFHLGCLRPCMHTHHFSIMDDKLYLTSTQRSADVPLGLPFNMIQTWFLLKFVAWLTGLEAGTVTHHIVNYHIYEDQWDGVEEQIGRIEAGMMCDNRNREAADDFAFSSALPQGCVLGLQDALDEIKEFNTDCVWFPDVDHLSAIEFPFSV